jgi:hypothetical protein
MHTLELTTAQIEQIIWAIDLAENTLEDLSDTDLSRMNINIDRKVLFALAETLETLTGVKAGA